MLKLGTSYISLVTFNVTSVIFYSIQSDLSILELEVLVLIIVIFGGFIILFDFLDKKIGKQ